MNFLNTRMALPIFLFTALANQQAEATVIIDDFQTYQEVTNNISSPISIGAGHTDLSNLTRKLSASANTPYETFVVIDSGELVIGTDDPGANSTASVFYSFNNFDIAALASAFELNVNDKDLSPISIEVIANANSFHVVQTISNPGLYAFNFADFSNTLAFTSLHSLEIKFTGSDAWDVAFGVLATNTNQIPTVPEPQVSLLMAIGLAGLFASGRKYLAAN